MAGATAVRGVRRAPACDLARRYHAHVQMATVTSSSVKSKSRRLNVGTNMAEAAAWSRERD
jgi:hypothetical protein